MSLCATVFAGCPQSGGSGSTQTGGVPGSPGNSLFAGQTVPLALKFSSLPASPSTATSAQWQWETNDLVFGAQLQSLTVTLFSSPGCVFNPVPGESFSNLNPTTTSITFSGLALGTYYVSVAVTDTAGNSASACTGQGYTVGTPASLTPPPPVGSSTTPGFNTAYTFGAAVSATGSIVSGSTHVTIATAGIWIGMTVTGAGIPAQAAVTGIGSGFVVLSAPATATNGAAALTFTQPNPSATAVGSASTAAIQVYNAGGVTATGFQVAMQSGQNFSITANTCPSTLPPGGRCQFKVDFSPSNVNTDNDIVLMTFNNGSSPTNQTLQSFTVQAQGISAATITTTPSSVLTFGGQPESVASNPITVTINNTGGLAATHMSVALIIGSQFSTSNSTCTATLGAGSSCTLQVTFKPTTTGPVNDTLSITYNNGAFTTSTLLSLQGTGDTPANLTLTSVPAGGALGNVTTNAASALAVTVTNTGQYTADISSIALTTGTVFTIQSTTCGPTLLGGKTCQVNVQFLSATLGPQTDTLTASYATGIPGPNANAQMIVSAVGVTPASLVISPAFTFGPDFIMLVPGVPVGASSTQLFSMSNGGGSPATNITMPILSSPFLLSQNSCPSTLAPGASCTFTVQFTPTVVGFSQPAFGVSYSNGNAGTQVYPGYLDGDGLTPASLSFAAAATPTTAIQTAVLGTVPVGATGGAVSIALYNSGGAAATTVYITPPPAGSPFTVSPNGCGTSAGSITLNGGGTCVFNITFQPTTAGTQSITIPVSYSNGLAQNQAASLSVSAIGQGASLAAGGATNNWNGGAATCAVSPSLGGEVLCWGNNTTGVLGGGGDTGGDSPTPAPVIAVSGFGALSGMTQVTMGEMHACALSSAGNVYCWGDNSYGELGNGTFNSTTTPVEVVGVNGMGVLSNIVQVAAGAVHTCALSNAGNVYCWGDDTYDEIGNAATSFCGDYTCQTTPIQVLGVGGSGVLNSIVQLSTGDTYAPCALSVAGNVFCWGWGSWGQLGNNGTAMEEYPVQVVGKGNVGVLSGITSISSGYWATYAVNSSGNVYAWGYNPDGELGNNTTASTATSTPVVVYGVYSTSSSNPLTGILSVTGGPTHACALTTSGQVDCWGQNIGGELGTGGIYPNESTPQRVFWGGYLQGIVALAAGSDQFDEGNVGFTCGATMSGNVYCWGYNAQYELGNSSQYETCDDDDSDHVCDPTPIQVVTPSADPPLKGLTAVSAGIANTCAISTAGAAYCWGSNADGQLGENATGGMSLTPGQVQYYSYGNGQTGALYGMTSIATMSSVACGGFNSGLAQCWGDNSWHELGNGATSTPFNGSLDVVLPFSPNYGDGGGDPPMSGVTAVGGSLDTACAISSTTGLLNCWGANDFGQLGDVSSGNCAGQACSDWGLPVEGVGGTDNLGGVTSVSPGWTHTCAISGTGAYVYCWGENVNGELGNGTNTFSLAPVSPVGVFPPNPLLGATSVSASNAFTCATLSTGGVYCWGINTYGQLGTDNTTSSNVPLQVVAPTGSGFLTGATSVSTGAAHACAVVSGNVYCWGQNALGQLGATSTSTCTGLNCSLVPLLVGGLPAGGIASVSAGYGHTCALTKTGTTYCWGLNNVDQLGAVSSGSCYDGAPCSTTPLLVYGQWLNL